MFLLQRNTRRIALTNLRRTFYEHCRATVLEAQSVIETALTFTRSLRGVVRISCPVTASQTLRLPALPSILRYSEITVQVQVSSRVVGLSKAK